MIKIGLISHSSRSDNLGVGALTASEVEILRSISQRIDVPIDIVILDWVGLRAPYITGPDIEVREMTGKTLLSPSGYFAMVRDCDLVIDIGAGDSFADIYGPKRLMRMFWMKYLVHIARRPLVLAPQTYGPFTKKVSTAFTRGTVKWSAIVTSRDSMSTAAIKNISPTTDVIEASDVALRLPYDTPAPHKSSGAQVGLNISGLLMKGGYTQKNMFGLEFNYQKMINDLIDRLLAHDDIETVHLVSHVIPQERGGVEDDLQPALELAERFPQIIVAPAFADPSEAKSYISGLDFFAGARMHACIAAFSSGVPVVPMAYSRKFEGLFGTLGYQHTVDCTTQTSEAVIDAVMTGFENRTQLAADIQPALKKGLAALSQYEKALETLFLEIIGHKNTK